MTPPFKSINAVLVLLFSVVTATGLFAQVGIGTTTPDTSSVLDLSSTTQGLLAPRMTTAQKTAITAPATGLIVYDTDIKAFFYFDGTVWQQINSAVAGPNARSNYKLVKSAADLAPELTAGGGTFYKMDSSTLYEINGSIVINNPIHLNNCCIIGQDLSMDNLTTSAGNLFEGETSGDIEYVTLTATNGKVFNLSGRGSSGNDLLRLTNCRIHNSAEVGTISSASKINFENLFFENNAKGMTFTDVDYLTLHDVAWTDTNKDTFLKLSGTIGTLFFSHGVFNVPPGAVGIDLSANPTISTSAILKTVTFTGEGTKVIGYGTGATADGGLFSNAWEVVSGGIIDEHDEIAKGSNFDPNTTTPTHTVINGTTGTKVNVSDSMSSNNVLRVSTATPGGLNTPNYLRYTGKKPRGFQLNATFSASELDQDANTNRMYMFYFVVNGTKTVVGSESLVSIMTPFKGVGIVPVTQNVTVNGSVILNPGDYVEVYVRLLSNPGSNPPTLVETTFNMSIH